MVRAATKRPVEEQTYLDQLCELFPAVDLANSLTQAFLALVRERRGDQLDVWIGAFNREASMRPRTTNLQVGVTGIIIGNIALLSAVGIFAEGRYATGRVWVMLGFFSITWGLADILPSRLHGAVRILRIATFLCGVLGFWLVLQL